MLEQLREVLRALKWTDYDIEVYVTLVQKGSMSPLDLAHSTGVPSGRIYDVLKSLEKRGAVIETNKKPKQVDAQNPRTILFGELDSLGKKIDGALITAEEMYDKRANSLNNNEELVWTVKGERGIVAQIRELMPETKTALLYCSNDISWLGKGDHKIIRKLITGKKTVKFLSSAGFKEDLEGLNGLGVTTAISNNSSSYCIIDSSTAVMTFGNSSSAIIIREKQFVEKLVKDFERDFKAAEKVEAKEFVS